MGILTIFEEVESESSNNIKKSFFTNSDIYYGLSLATSLYASFLIAIRVILAQRDSDRAGVKDQSIRTYSRIIELVVESFLIHSVNLLAYVILTARKDHSLSYPQNLIPQVAVSAYFNMQLEISANNIQRRELYLHYLSFGLLTGAPDLSLRG